jgi:outer membrane lipopolysaccharide assembly protein LptE/RlpB
LSDPAKYPGGRRRLPPPPWLIIGLLGILAACGYRFSGAERYPGGVRTLFIGMLENQTSETGIEVTLADALVAEFTLQRSRALVASPGGADAHLSGVVKQVTIRTISSRGKDAAAERRVTVEVELKLTGRDGQVLWKATRITDNESYPVSEDKFVTEFNRRAAETILSRRIAERIYNRFTDDF